MPIHVVTSADWQRVAFLIGDAAAADSMEEMVELIMRHTHRLFDAEMIIFDRLDGQMRQLGFQMYPSPAPEMIRRVHPPFLAYFHEHPFHRDWVKTVGRGGVCLLSDRISGRDFRCTAFWNEAFIHLRGKNQLMVGGRIEPDRYWNFSMMRLGGDFGPRDREIGRFLQPQLDRLLQRQARRDRACQAVRVLDQNEAAYLVLDAGGRMLEISDKAQALLVKSGPAAKERLARFATRQAKTGIGSEDWGNLQAIMLRASPQGLLFVLLGENGPTTVTAPGAPTPREAEILHWLGEGKTNVEIGVLLGVSARTVEKHCEHLFAKLGVENRLAAALMSRR